MFQLYADIQSGFGKVIVDMLKKNYPDQKVDINPATVGHKMMAIFRKQNQGDDDRSMDAIQDWLTYLTTGSKTVPVLDDKGEPVIDPETKKPKRKPRTEAEPHAAAFEESDTWQGALDKLYANMRTRGITKSIETQRRKKREKSTDDAFGKRGEEGGAPEGGEARIPTSDGGSSDTNTESVSELGKALDDKAAVKEFYDLLDVHIGDLKDSLSPDSRALFDLIFEDEIGGFGSDIKDNMGQATALKEKNPELYEKNAKRWSGFVGDLRKKLLNEIWKYMDDEMSDKDYKRLKEMFFADTTPEDISKVQKDKGKGKADYQRGIDERKLARFKWQEKEGKLSDKDKKSFESLTKKLKDQGVDVEKIEAKAPEKGKKDESEGQAQTASIASRLAAHHWMS